MAIAEESNPHSTLNRRFMFVIPIDIESIIVKGIATTLAKRQQSKNFKTKAGTV